MSRGVHSSTTTSSVIEQPSSSSTNAVDTTEEEPLNNPIIISSEDRVIASWFDRTTIHAKEMEHFPEYFTHHNNDNDNNNNNNNKTPKIYKKIRNDIIDYYEKDTKNYVTVTTLRQHVIGDVCILMKLYEFLNAYFIINYDVIQSPYVRTSTINEFVPFNMYENPQEAEKVIMSLRAKKDEENTSIEHIYDIYHENSNKPKIAIEEIQKLAKGKIEELQDVLQNQMEEFLEFKYKILQQRLRLLDHVDKGLCSEYEEIEACKRDNQIKRAYISYINSHQ